jgi:hypothetical protein
LEAIMSSPIHHSEDLDAALIYAPPWARKPGAPPAEPSRSQHLANRRRGFSGDRAMQEVQRQLALNPDQVPQPPLEGAAHLWPMALRLSAVAAAAALVAWGMVALPGTKRIKSETVQADVPATPDTKLVQLPSAAIVPPLVPDALTKANTPPVKTEPIPPPQSAPSPSVSGTLALDKTEPIQPAQSAPSPSVSGTLVLDSDEIATLVKRGQDSLQNGDLASARLLLRRAAEAGNAKAALALGMTYDPLVIQRLGVIGIVPDTARARKWYQKAADLGSGVASEQLVKLEQVR